MLKKLLILFIFCLPAVAAEKVIHHTDRTTPKLIFEPDFPVGQNKDAVATAYLQQNWRRLGLRENAANLEQGRVQESLLGRHNHYPQMYQGLPVEGSEVIVSVRIKGNSIYRVFNNSWPEPINQTLRKEYLELDSDEALQLAWEHLRVHGILTAMPSSEKVWLVEDGTFTLIWRTQLVVDAPYGNWSLAINALTGEVISAKDISIYRKPRETTDYQAYQGPIMDRVSDTLRLQSLEAERLTFQAAAKRANGSGSVFDPDPRTSLNDASLEDNSQDFTGAYFTRDLLDITESGGSFSLVGPWVQIIDFENPVTAPSVSADGTWNFTRGNNAFNDAMTYFHLDQSQRYMQGLGFSGTKAIQNVSIETDSDGLNGADNSHYLSDISSIGINRLSFGHGCVDDNEDADVILHEYGHAINKFINNNWNGGDTGGMGEGFGDYWGAAYSYTTPNGKIFHPEWIYSWDGHSIDCWPGRNMDLTDLVYDPNETYTAHRFIPGGFSDELWGTPLFQAMINLDNQGHGTAESDQIILEAQFGLGAGLRMPDMAEATVQAAAMLFPNGPHANTFQTAFAVHSILSPIVISTFTYTSAHVPPDNDWVNEIQLVNPGTMTANISAHVYELSGSVYMESSTTPLTLAAGEATTYTPLGSAQRWVSFESDQPLAGTSFFSRIVSGRGEEKAGIPLFKAAEKGTRLIIPHIPSNREFFSAAVMLNPNNVPAALSYELYDSEGNDLTSTLTDAAPSTLAAREKWVGFLSPFPNLTSLFDDEGGGNLVSYVVINSDQPLNAFELFGYKADEGGTTPLATSGIKALPDMNQTTYPVRVSLTGSLYSAFTILNPGSSSQSINVAVLDKQGQSLAAMDTTVPARGKMLGLNIDDPAFAAFFRLPSDTGALVDLSNPQDIQAVVVTGTNLRVFELNGSGISEIDGSTVNAPASSMVFAKPQGILEVFKVSGSGTVTVITTEAGQPTTATAQLNVGESMQIPLSATVDSVVVSGENITAAVINQNQTDGSLSIVNGDQLEGSSGKAP